MILDLVQNIALLVALAVGVQMLAWRTGKRPALYALATGLLFGTVGIIGMMTPMRFAPGVIYDGRSIVLSLAGLFGGPAVATLAALMCGAYRLHLGGAGVFAGVGTVVEAAALGIILHYLRRRDEVWVDPARLWLFAVIVHAVMLALQLLIPNMGWDILRRIGPSVLFFYPLAFLLIARVFLDAEHRRQAEAALRQSEARLARINTSLSSLGPDFDVNIASLTALCGELLGATCASYSHLERGMLRVAAGWHAPPDYAAKDELEGQICYDIIRQGNDEVLVLRNLPHTSYAATDPNVAKYGLKTYLGHATRCAGKPVGCLSAAFQEDMEPTGDDKRILGIIASSITNQEDLKREEEEKAALQDQLVHAQKMESIGRLAGGVAHDFNNMLGVILGHAELTLDQVGPADPLRADLEEICKAASRSAGLTQQLLAFARKQTVAPKVLNLNETVAGMLKMLRRLIGENISLNWRPETNLWSVKVDPSQVDQILANLCVNARDAIAEGGTITIETGNSVFDEAYCAGHPGFTPGEHVRLAVSDDGCGMDKDTMAHIFEPFFSTKGVGEGTGLGLATVYGVVTQNNGFLDVHSEPGKGAVFTVYLPRHAGKIEKAQTEGPTKPTVSGHETILLVEDEPSVLKLTTKLLEMEGYTVLIASAPGEALRVASEKAGEIHLLMTDVVMPGMSGRDLAQSLRARNPALKVLFMSGYTAEIMTDRSFLDEGMHFVQKPFTRRGLAMKLREVLEQP